jgi:uncharacterized HAD superfamily protein
MNVHTKPIPISSLAFDIDCVVADTMEAFIRIAHEEHGIHVKPEEITRFNVEECLEMDDTIVDDIFQKLMVDPIGHQMRLLDDAQTVLQKIQHKAPLAFITARPDKAPIAAWLEKELGKQATADMRIIAMGDHDGKKEHIQNLGISHFIDDRFETCEHLDKEEITAIVYDQPWNRGRHDLPVVRNWQDIHDCCFG